MQPGARATVELTVTDADTAIALGSGDVPVLGTPRVLALVEQATVNALTLEAGQTTVGTRVELEHLAATPVGGSVVATATLATVDGRRLAFDVTVYNVSGGEQSLAARGTVERVVVDRERFLGRL